MSEILPRVEFKGTPAEIGQEVFVKLGMPIVNEAQKRAHATPKQTAQLYAGFISACLGSMTADFGQEQAARIAQTVLDAFKLSEVDPTARKQ